MLIGRFSGNTLTFVDDIISSFIYISPVSSFSSPQTNLKKDVFPQPESPNRHKTSPGNRLRDISEITFYPELVQFSFSTLSLGAHK